MGELITYPSNGSQGEGWLDTPFEESQAGLVVIQEWWGLNANIKEITSRFSNRGFLALAPDLYHGELTAEPDEAGKMMMALDIERAAKDLTGAVDELQQRGCAKVGVIGFCMGGGLALWLASLRSDVAAVAPFYGLIPWDAAQPDYSNLKASVQGHYAEADDWAGPPAVAELEETLRAAGVTDIEMFVYPGAQHAFFNDTRPEVFDAEASALAWDRVLEFFTDKLGATNPRS
ncbi:MAG TPA: dienelactone hydrolase family protein [Acidimicrobiales bacterium]|nr:dienelactone hydrolase family protein [Acidimicrobiales bacterium]